MDTFKEDTHFIIFIFTIHKLSTTKLANYKMDMFLFQEHIHFHICHWHGFNYKGGKLQNGNVQGTYPFSYLPFLYPFKNLANCKMDMFTERFHFHICHWHSFNNKAGKLQNGYFQSRYPFSYLPFKNPNKSGANSKMENVQGTYPFSYLPLTQFRIQQSWQITKWIHSRNISIFIFAIQISKQKRGKFQNEKRTRNISIFIFAILIHIGHFNTRSKTWQIAKWICSQNVSIFIFAIDIDTVSTTLANYKMDTFKEDTHFHIYHS